MSSWVHRNITVYFFAFLVGAWLGGCAPKPIPLAFEEDASYYYFVGISSNALSVEAGKRQATQHAFGELARYFGVTVSAEMTIERVETNNTFEIHVQDESMSQSLEPLVRNAVVDDVRHTKNRNGTYEVIVRLRYSKEQYQQEKQRQARIEKQKAQQALELLHNAQESDDANDMLNALIGYLNAYTVAGNTESARPVRALTLQALGELVLQLRFSKVSGDHQSASVADGLPEHLIVKLLRQRDDSLVPLANIPVHFAFMTGRAAHPPDIQTQADGIASCRIGKIEQIANEFVVEAHPNFDEAFRLVDAMTPEQQVALANIVQGLQSLRVTFQFTVATGFQPNSRIALSIEEKVGGQRPRDSIVSAELEAALTGAGFRVVSDPETLSRVRARFGTLPSNGRTLDLSIPVEYVLVGEVRTEISSQNEGVVVSSHASGQIRLVSATTGEQVFAKSANRIRGFGETGSKSLADARINLAKRLAEEVVQGLNALIGNK